MRITVLAGGVGGSRFVLGLREECRRRFPDGNGGSTAEITVVTNAGDDLWLAELRLWPDFDSMLYALAGVNDAERGWGRSDESERVSAQLRAWGVGWPWFTLGDLDLGTHIARTAWLRAGETPTQVAARLSRRWPLGVRLLPASDTEVDTHVVTTGVDAARQELHFQEWWTRYGAEPPALKFRQRNIDNARPTPEVLGALASADLVLFAPSNPVVSIGSILAIPGMTEAVRATPGRVLGVAPIIAGAAVRGMAEQCLRTIGVAVSAEAVALHYGARITGGLLDGWLVDETDADSVPRLEVAGMRSRAVPLWMRDLDTSAALAGEALA